MISKPSILMHFLSLIFLESADILGFADVQICPRVYRVSDVKSICGIAVARLSGISW